MVLVDWSVLILVTIIWGSMGGLGNAHQRVVIGCCFSYGTMKLIRDILLGPIALGLAMNEVADEVARLRDRTP